MKKRVLLIIISPLTIFASDIIFDFKNSKPFGGEVETNLTVSSELKKEDEANILFEHNLGVRAEVYEIMTLGAKVGYGYKGSAKQVYFDAENTELMARTNFKKYGNLGVLYKFGGKYGPELEVKYANEGKLYSTTVGGHILYKRIFTPDVKIGNINFWSDGMRLGDGEMYVSYNFNKNLSLTCKAGVNVNVNTQKLVNEDMFKRNMIETDVRLGSKVDVTINTKVKFSTYNELGVMINKMNFDIVDVRKSSASLRFETDNQLKIRVNRELLIIPRVLLSVDKLETNLNTNLKADYYINNGLSFNGGIGFKNKFKSKKYESTTPYAKGGVVYKW